MNKRKASADRNSKHKESSRRPSTSSLHQARPRTVQQKHQSPEKQPSTRNLAETSDSARMVSKAVDTCTPKTRFSSQDRCRESRTCSSPRLKYFPAEKIKKLEHPPPFTPKPIGAVIVQQDPQESGVVYVGTRPDQRCDNGQGDAATLAQQSHQYRQTPGMQTVSQQQVAPQQTSHQIGQMNPHSECALPQQVPNVQSHRPFVPHGSREFSPRKNPHATFLNPAQAPASSQPSVQQVPNRSGSAVDPGKIRNDHQSNGSELDLDKQPVGGRNAALYRNVMMTSAPNAADNVTLNRSNVNDQRVQNQYFAHGHDTPYRSPANPQQIYQQLQQNIAQQQQMQLRAMTYQQQMNGGPYNYNAQQFGRYLPGQGMVVPQDVAANQIQNTRMMTSGQQNYPVHQRDLNHTVNPQNGWIKNNQVAEYSSVKAQLKPFNVEVVNRNQPLYREQSQQQQFVPQYHQPATLYQQQPVQHQPRQLYRDSEQGNLTMQEHRNLMTSDQPAFNQQTNFNSQSSSNQQFNPQQVSNNDSGVQSRKKKPLKFTVGMVRDQEKLLAAMKQQGVPMDIMRRQFEALLNEQRRHLEYLEHIQHQEDSQEVRRPVSVSRKRKEQDEKPEWMVHLTPPRLSYTEIERIHEQRRKERELQQLQMMQQQQQHGMNEMSDQQVPVQVTNQQNYQHWQPSLQQQGVQQRYNNMFAQPQVVSGPGNANEPVKQTNYQPNVPRYQYVYQQPHQQSHQQTYQYPYQQPPQQYYNQQLQQYQQLYRPTSQPNREPEELTSHYPSYEENRPSTEPSSLLKLRLYKNEIRPQKRNNGLQDPEIARRQLEDLRVSAETRRGLEYLANLAAKKQQQLKLNGMQERNDLEAEFQQRLITSGYQPPDKRVSANGLENSRDPNNPPPQRLSNLKKAEQEFLREYPRQKQTNPRNCYSVQAEKENGAVALEQPQMFVQQQLPGQNAMAVIPYNEKSPTMGRGNAAPFKFEENYPQHYQQMQQYYQNTRNLARNNGEGDVGSTQRVHQGKWNFDHAGGDAIECVNGTMNGQMTEGKAPLQRTYYSQPNIHEARTIGGVRYLARKQDYLPNQQLVAPETLIGSRLVQPPMIY